MVRAMGGILKSCNEAVLALASEAAVKLISVLPSLMLQPHVGHLCHPLSSLLSTNHVQVAVTSSSGLNLIISNLSVKKEKEVWEILDKTGAVVQLISNLRNFSDKLKPIEYFLEMASLLSSIMQLWPPSRYPVWNDAKLMEVMEDFCSKPETNVKVAVFKLYSALALCGYGAQKLLENAEGLIETTVQCMGKSQPYSVRILAFKLAQHLMANKEGCLKVLSISCEHVVKSITCALSDSSMHRGSVSNHEVSLKLEACQLALITRWPGKHHAYLWKSGVDRVLHDLLLHNCQDMPPHSQSLSVEELVMMTKKSLNANYLLDLRSYVWEIIGWLSAHCEEGFLLNKHKNELYVSVLIATACLAVVDSIGRKRLLLQADRAYTYRSISAAKATMMMIYSPCKYIASQTRLVLSEVLGLDGEEHLKYLIHALNFVHSGDTSRMRDGYQMLITLIGLTCYSGMPQFYRQVSNGGTKSLLAFVKWWLNNYTHIERLSLCSHLQNTAKEEACCRIDLEEWEGKDIHLLLALWSLAELVNNHTSEGLEEDIFAGQTTYSKEEFIKDIMDISIDSTTSYGLRWYCSYLLSFFGFYGFPSKLGKRIVSAFGDEDYSDMRLVLGNGQSLNVHRVVLLVGCPSLLPSEDPSDEERTQNSIGTKKEVILSAQVDEQALVKMLDFIYSGYLQAGGDIIRKLKILAKHCNMQPLLQLLCKERPKWGASIPSSDLTQALGSFGHDFSDIILESNSTENTEWTCSWCSIPALHIHAHRVILCSSCEYMRALFQSGMQESRSESLKVPISWEALRKLVTWIYSNDIPKPVTGCLWANMDVEKKVSELQPYIELCWLAEFWFLDDVQNECLIVITSSLDSAELSIKLIQLAADYSQWKLVYVAEKWIAPAYHKLRRSGALDFLDEGLVEMIRLASVRLSQG